ncbi:TraR/DksA family transcriptional regulator [Paractinoplanes toevensis]|uniref:Zinc finger DksA/TraR C4-type domain-containing protein n=1 Tax=Paractinoplanes toevensis TaxID=571911 RepID=A0A919T8X0_9ACTN|nr:TraR/DksA C4-type zinc finger protein [Actinoplanes toevensis]GIM89864.1 hypothetical protein Ato02nite_016570 [Actinoplanes toevensis]
MTSTVHDPLDRLRVSLEEQFLLHTQELTQLTVSSRQPDLGGHDRDTMTARIESTRRAVAETAQALRRIAEGSYGTCQRCGAGIPLERLEIRPYAQFCVPCQRQQTG